MYYASPASLKFHDGYEFILSIIHFYQVNTVYKTARWIDGKEGSHQEFLWEAFATDQSRNSNMALTVKADEVRHVQGGKKGSMPILFKLFQKIIEEEAIITNTFQTHFMRSP